MPIDSVLNLSAFDLDQMLEKLLFEPEYPFEWTGVYKLEPGRYKLSLEEGPDPNMSLVATLHQGAEKCDVCRRC